MKELIEKARVLLEALPYIRTFAGKLFVIKIGGKVLTSGENLHQFAQDVALLRLVGIGVVVVHGGGPEINKLLERMGKKPKFFQGLRVTDNETLKYVEMALARLNMEIVRLINQYGGRAIGLSGNDSACIIARKIAPKGKDIGLVGEVERVDAEVIQRLVREGFIPVIMPTGVTHNGEAVNINADEAASKIAVSLKAEKLMMLTDVDGVLDKRSRHVHSMNRRKVRRYLKEGIIAEGMIPKVQACLGAVEGGVTKSHIINGTVEHAVLLEIFTREGIGTEFIA